MSGFEPIPEEAEVVSGPRVARLLGWTGFSIVICVVVVWALRAFDFSGGGRSDVQHLALSPPAQPFSAPLPDEAQRAAAAALNDRWTWADPQHTRVRLPIHRALERYVERYQAQGGSR